MDPSDPAWATSAPATPAASAAPDTTEAPNETLEALVTALLQQRADAKAQRDWDRADAIRDLLQAHVAPVVDTPAGAQCGPVTLG